MYKPKENRERKDKRDIKIYSPSLPMYDWIARWICIPFNSQELFLLHRYFNPKPKELNRLIKRYLIEHISKDMGKGIWNIERKE